MRLTLKSKTAPETVIEASVASMPRGTVQDIKSVPAPSQSETMADVDFMMAIAAKAKASAQTAAATPKQPCETAPVHTPRVTHKVSAAPSFVPAHKKVAGGKSDAPVFSVQSAPRSAKPDFLNTDIEEKTSDDALAPEEEVVAAPKVMSSAELASALSVLDLDFGKVAAQRPAEPAMMVIDEPVHVRPSAKAAVQAVAMVDPSPVAEEISPKRTARLSLSKVFKGRKGRGKSVMAAASDMNILEAPRVLQKLMSKIPVPGVPEGLTDYAREKLAQDPFDRLMAEAKGA